MFLLVDIFVSHFVLRVVIEEQILRNVYIVGKFTYPRIYQREQ